MQIIRKKFVLRDGSFSIILGNGYYDEFIDNLEGNMNINPLFKNYEEGNDIYPKNTDNSKLMKISYIHETHNEKIIDELRKIKNHDLYFCIQKKKVIHKRSLLYNFISTLKFDNKIHNMIDKQLDLYYSYILNVGDLDFHYGKIYDNNDLSIWEEDTTKKMVEFIKYSIDALDFLHIRKIVHLDIKPENIMYNELSTSKFGKDLDN